VATLDESENLLVPGTNFPSVNAWSVKLVRIGKNGITFSNKINGKRRLLSDSPSDATYLAFWTDQSTSSVFSVSEEMRERWVGELSSISEQS
jgi:hypothetical protein